MRPPAGCGTVRGVGAHGTPGPVVRLELRLQFSRESVAGTLGEPGRPGRPFEGWLALLAALQESAPGEDQVTEDRTTIRPTTAGTEG